MKRSNSPALPRRGVLIGAGVAGAAALAASKLAAPLAAAPSDAPQAAPRSEEPAGYRLTAHVQRYYQTTKV